MIKVQSIVPQALKLVDDGTTRRAATAIASEIGEVSDSFVLSATCTKLDSAKVALKKSGILGFFGGVKAKLNLKNPEAVAEFVAKAKAFVGK